MHFLAAALTLSGLAVHAEAAGVISDEKERDIKLLPPKFVAEKYGLKMGDKVDADTAEKIAKEATEMGERTPYFAAAGGDEMLMLPEVFSKLNPDDVQRDFVADDDLQGQQGLRETRWWGRLYVDGWPQSIQYLRGHFGEAPPQGIKRVVAADPEDACAPLTNEDEVKGAIVIALRGNCTFGSKGVRVHAAGASALVLVNNEDGNHHIPAPDAHDLEMSVSMMARQDGNLLMKSLRLGQDLTGALVPIHCSAESQVRVGSDLCQAATTEDRAIISGTTHGGWISAGEEKIGEFLIATFGLRVPSSAPRIVMADPPTLCNVPADNEALAGKAVVVHRGECQFIEKAESAAKAGASMLIIVNTETSLSRFGVEPRWRGLNIDIPVIMVTDIAGEKLERAAQENWALNFKLSTSVSKSDWEDVSRFISAEAWSSKRNEDEAILAAALEKHAGWEERQVAIQKAFSEFYE